MKKSWLAFMLVLACFAAACSSNTLQQSVPAFKSVNVIKKDNPPKTFIPGEMNIVAIGDSLTAGVGDKSGKGGYVGTLKRKLEQEMGYRNILINNHAVGGHTTNNLITRLEDSQVIDSLEQADMVVMTIGGNDVMRVVRNHFFQLTIEPFQREQQNFGSRFEKIVSEIRSHNEEATIVFVGLYNPFKYALPELSEIDSVVGDWNDRTNETLTRDGNALFVPIADIFEISSVRNLLAEDEFHPNGNGYELMGERVFEVLVANEDL
ncbi:SGNH/GDSL hydrolase family protein [Metabacillus lacus]|nr:SGNH/GDSL hydrolase family protein [Metabacillus lacus]